jgi:hypothetical protein
MSAFTGSGHPAKQKYSNFNGSYRPETADELLLAFVFDCLINVRIPSPCQVFRYGLHYFTCLRRPNSVDSFAERVVSCHQQFSQLLKANLVLSPAN